MVDYTQYASDYPRVYKKLYRFLSDANALRSEQNSKHRYYAPAKVYEQKHGITGISGHWKMPDGCSEDSLEKEILDRAFLRRRIQDKLDGVIIVSVIENGHLLTKQAEHKLLRELSKPHGLLREALDKLYNKLENNELAFYNDLLDRLRDINPEIRDRNIDRTTIEMVFHEIEGIISQFTLQDIDFYHASNAEFSKTGKFEKNHTPEYNKMYEQIRSNFSEPGWAASPQTIESIIRQMENKSFEAPQSSPPKRKHASSTGDVFDDEQHFIPLSPRDENDILSSSVNEHSWTGKIGRGFPGKSKGK